MSIILNEREWVEQRLSKRQLGRNPMETLSRVARYYSQVEGFRKGEVGDRLEDFLLQCDPDVTLVKWANTIEKIVGQADKYPLIEIEGVRVTAEECAMIHTLEGIQIQRLAFTLLCISKYWDLVRPTNKGWVNTVDKEIMKMANINTSVQRQSMMFHNLREEGFLKFGCRVDSLSVQVLFQSEGTVILEVIDFRNLGNQYMASLGGRYMQCAHCGITVKRNSNSQRFCRVCAGEGAVRRR